MAAKHRWGHWAAPLAFLSVATIAIVIVASALHHKQQTATTETDTQSVTLTRSSSQATTTKHGRRFYTVVAGDTFGVIAGKTGVSVAELERLNPGVSATALHIGQKLRVS